MLLILKNINFIIPLICLELLKQGMQKSLEDLQLNKSGFSQIQFEKAKTQHKESIDNVGLIYVGQSYHVKEPLGGEPNALNLQNEGDNMTLRISSRIK